MLIDHTNGRVVDVLESRDKQTLVRWLAAAKASGLLSELEEVTCDMWDAYVKAPREVFGASVRITVDRFHVMSYFQDRLTEARRDVQAGIGRHRSKELKGSRWLWLTKSGKSHERPAGEIGRIETGVSVAGDVVRPS